jgi:hypothetical protein
MGEHYRAIRSCGEKGYTMLNARTVDLATMDGNVVERARAIEAEFDRRSRPMVDLLLEIAGFGPETTAKDLWPERALQALKTQGWVEMPPRVII